MNERKRALPEGWYPSSEKAVLGNIDEWNITFSPGGTGCAAIVPHAGWYFSGRLAAETISRMDQDLDTVIVAGGHLLPGSPLYSADEDNFDVPGGFLKNNHDLRNFIDGKFDLINDLQSDNTVEIQLPFVFQHWKNIKILWIRIPPDEIAEKLAAAVYGWTMDRNEKTGVIGSTDLTHYGDSYGFTPAGRGREGLKWMKETNDRNILEAMENLDIDGIIDMGNRKKAACSSGSAAFAASWAKLNGVKSGKLLDYYTSYDIQPGSSFVGYGGIIYEKNH